MATVQEIEQARKNGVHDADMEIVEAIARRNGSHSQKTRDDLNDLINQLMAARTALSAKACEAEDDTQEMKDALAALSHATINLKRVAEIEKKLSEFLQLAAGFATAGTQLAGAIKAPA